MQLMTDDLIKTTTHLLKEQTSTVIYTSLISQHEKKATNTNIDCESMLILILKYIIVCNATWRNTGVHKRKIKWQICIQRLTII